MRKSAAATFLVGVSLMFSASLSAATRWIDVYGNGLIWVDRDGISQKNGLTYFTIERSPSTSVTSQGSADSSGPSDAIDCKSGDYYHHDIVNFMEVAQHREREFRYAWAKTPDYPVEGGLREILRKAVCEPSP
ncbi:MAG: hypothetical protein HY243_07705 [Proteobacteria bacterium]|nr:hypothetical protein [Pseudomonadota bacterium]